MGLPVNTEESKENLRRTQGESHSDSRIKEPIGDATIIFFGGGGLHGPWILSRGRIF